MKSRVLSVALMSACLALSACNDDDSSGDPTVVTTTEGTIKGTLANDVISFLGVPYAAPPIGALRWKPPQPPAQYAGTYDATSTPSICVQGSSTAPRGSEDCLYLNIFRPVSNGQPVSNAPVLVRIHGGGYSTGSGLMFNVIPLVKSQNVVAVSINYRLGALGFLAHPALSAEQGGTSGNYGIMDMQAALKWVQANIRNFGGDPNNVTIFGESAGGNAMLVLMASPASAGLFHKAHPESGGYYRNQPTLQTAEATGLNLATTNYACPSSDQPAMALCLRGLSVATILSRSVTEPIVDGKILTETTPSAFRNGRFNKVPLMAGSTHQETTGFLGSIPATPANYLTFGQFNGYSTTEIAARYPISSFNNLPNQALAQATTDYHWVCSFMQDAEAIAAYVPNVYAYDFDDETPASNAAITTGYPTPTTRLVLGAYHASDTVYWLGLLQPADQTPARVGLVDAMMRYLGTFAKTGDPNYAGGTPWAKFNGQTRQMMRFAYPLDANYNGYADHQCEFWYAAPPSESLF
jgi:para-nitrobenzyl esterase